MSHTFKTIIEPFKIKSVEPIHFTTHEHQSLIHISEPTRPY